MLNDALTRYKTQGGDVRALTAGTPMANVLARLKTPVNWCGVTHQFLQTALTYPARSLKAVGSGHQYRFFTYNSYVGEAPGPGVPTSEFAYGEGVGYVENDGVHNYGMSGTSSTGFIAYKNAVGTVTINTIAALSPTPSITFWSCKSAVDSTPQGNLTAFNLTNNTYVTKVDYSGLTSLTTYNLAVNPTITYANLSNTKIGTISNQSAAAALVTLLANNCPSLTTVDLGAAAVNLSEFSVTNSPNLTTLCLWSTLLQSIDLSSTTKLTSVSVRYTPLTNISLKHCPDLQSLNIGSTNIQTLDVAGLSKLDYLYTYLANDITSIDISGTKLASIDITNAAGNITTFKAENCSFLTSVIAPSHLSLTSFSVAGSTNLSSFSLFGCSNILPTGMNLSGCTGLTYIQARSSPLAKPSANLNDFIGRLPTTSAPATLIAGWDGATYSATPPQQWTISYNNN